MPYYPRPPAEIKNLPKPVRHRIASAAWRRVVRQPIFFVLLALNSLALGLMFVQAIPGLVSAPLGYAPLPGWFWSYGEYITFPGIVVFFACLFVAPSLYRRAVRDILREENIRPGACLTCGWVVGNLECYSCPGCGELLLMPERDALRP